MLSKFAFGYGAFSRAGPTVVLQDWRTIIEVISKFLVIRVWKPFSIDFGIAV